MTDKRPDDRKPAEALSRRTALAGLAVLPAIGLPIAAAAEPDPIFAAIERHRQAETAKNECYVAADRLVEQGHEVDFNAYTNAAYNGAWDALYDLSETLPTTIAGMLAMVIYAQELRASNWQNFLSETEVGDRIIEALATAAKALITTQA